MTSFSRLTRRARMRRLRQVAQQALDAYGLSASQLTFLAYEGNAIYRVDTAGPVSAAHEDHLYHPNRFVLRVHMDYHSTRAIRSELQWLSALRQDLDLPVPEPIPTVSGDLVTEVSIAGDETLRRKCSLLTWVKGRFVSGQLDPNKVRAWGRLTGRLQEHSAVWKPPRDFTRPGRDWEGLFSDAAGFEFPAAELWEAVPKDFKESFDTVTRRVRQVMSELGTRPDVYGLVHADLDINTNILFKGGQARVIDFDDCAFAYWLHDLAFALSPWQGDPREPWVRETFLEGYSEIRTLPQLQLKHLDLFMAAFDANLLLWMLDWARLRPESIAPAKFVDKYGNNLLRYCYHH